MHGAHPDLTWVAPSGAHEMLRRDVDESVVAAAAHTPFEASFRVFVLERADTMNDEAANALLKTLEEPPGYVVLLLLTDRATQVLPTIASRCQPVRFDAPAPAELTRRLEARGAAPAQAAAAARLSLGDGERALALALGDGAALRAHAEAFARAPLHGRVGAERPWLALLDVARKRGAAARAAHEERLAEELQFLPKKEHKRRETEVGEQARRAERRAEPPRSTTPSSSSGSGTATSPASPPARPSSPTTPTAPRSSPRTPPAVGPRRCAPPSSSSTRRARGSR